jgi:hypothetical protein
MITERDALERIACECYAAVCQEYRRLQCTEVPHPDHRRPGMLESANGYHRAIGR